jgi:hypothetical protein
VQSCAIYGKSPSLEQAIIKGKPVKITTTQGKKYKFKEVYKVDGKFWGITDITYPPLFSQTIINSNSNTYQVEITDLSIEKIQIMKVSWFMTYIYLNLLLLGIWIIAGSPDWSIGY